MHSVSTGFASFLTCGFRLTNARLAGWAASDPQPCVASAPRVAQSSDAPAVRWAGHRPAVPRSSRRSVWALTATTMVDALIRTAPAAGGRGHVEPLLVAPSGPTGTGPGQAGAARSAARATSTLEATPSLRNML